jgi:DHA1 family bicyclomycin/chloramphenicol resistance-like MFS transporter
LLTSTSGGRLGQVEFIALIGLLISLAALSIDGMLAALPDIGRDLGVTGQNEIQLVISTLFLGMAFAPLIYGPLSDMIGRKPSIAIGVVIFMAGCLMSILATSFWFMLAGRLAQGIGAAGPRTVLIALVRDLYKGREMARMMSFIMAVFIMVPVIAPVVGQAIQLAFGWRWIFVMFLALSLVGLTWLLVRQPETLPAAQRTPISAPKLWAGIVETCTNRQAFGYTMAAGPVFGAFAGYLISSQQILQVQYGLGTLFPIYFAGLALAIGAASFVNGYLVVRIGMRRLCWSALAGMTALSVLFLVFAYGSGGHPNLIFLMAYLAPVFFCFGILLGNFNALAMEPMGHVAGIASAFITSVTTLFSMILGTIISQAYDGTVMPLVIGYTVFGIASLAIMAWTEKGVTRPNSPRSEHSPE